MCLPRPPAGHVGAGQPSGTIPPAMRHPHSIPRNVRITLLALFALVRMSTSAAEEKRVPLRVEVPPPTSAMFHTNHHIKDPDVEWPGDPNKSGLTVPVGTENVARGMPVAVDGVKRPTLGSLDQVTDGEKWGTDDCFVELPPGVRWIQIDLRASTPIYAVALWQTQGYDRAYRDVIVQVSDDAEFKRGVTTIFNNDADGSSGQGKGTDREYADTAMGRLIDARGVRARYERLYSSGYRQRGGFGGGETHWSEVEVYGTPTTEGRAFRDQRRPPAERPSPGKR